MEPVIGRRNWKMEIRNWVTAKSLRSSLGHASSVRLPLRYFASAHNWWLSLCLAALSALGLPPDAFAQGCAMCYTSASAAKKAGLEALRNGVLILLIPPLLIFAAILWQTYRRSNAQGAAVSNRREANGVAPEDRDLNSAPRMWVPGIFTETRKSNNIERTQSNSTFGS